MRPSNRIATGSGVYSCRICSRMTRSTGRGDNENCILCAECFDLGGNENSVSDTGALYDSPAQILAWIDYIQARGGNVAPWAELRALAEADEWIPEDPDEWKRADDKLMGRGK